MAPSGDMPTEDAQQQSFSLANMVPQTAELNRGIWAGVEMAVRTLAEREGELFLVTGPAFHGEQIRSIGSDGVLVPTSTWKAVYDPKANGTGGVPSEWARDPARLNFSERTRGSYSHRSGQDRRSRWLCCVKGSTSIPVALSGHTKIGGTLSSTLTKVSSSSSMSGLTPMCRDPARQILGQSTSA
jgi:hypothetical protein